MAGLYALGLATIFCCLCYADVMLVSEIQSKGLDRADKMQVLMLAVSPVVALVSAVVLRVMAELVMVLFRIERHLSKPSPQSLHQP